MVAVADPTYPFLLDRQAWQNDCVKIAIHSVDVMGLLILR